VLAATFLEVAFVLESTASGFGWTRASVASALEAIVDEPGFAVEHGGGAARRRGDLARPQRRCSRLLSGRHDCYLDAVARERGTRVLSFDKDLGRLGSGERP